MIPSSHFFSLPQSLPFADFFNSEDPPWEWIPMITKACETIESNLDRLDIPPGLHCDGNLFIHPSVKLPPYGSITGPAYIGEGTELRPGVYIRGNVIAGANCVMGNSCEFKNCLLMDQVQVPHFNYVGDSILGNKSHLGAGVICSNLRLDQANITVRLPDNSRYDTGLRKMGAILGDSAEVGCNAVLNPGSMLGKQALVVPTVAFSGYLEEKTIAIITDKRSTLKRKI